MTRRRRILFSAAVLAACVGTAFGVLALLPPQPGVTKANFDRIKDGMTRAEVEAILGKPDMEHLATRWGHGRVIIAIAFDENDKVEGRRFHESTETIPAKLRRWLGLPEAPPGPEY